MFGTIALNFFSDSSESDSDDASFLNSRIHFRMLRDATNVFDIPEEQFQRNFRVNKTVFSILLEEISPKLTPTYRITHIPAPMKLAKFLAFIATGVGNINCKYAPAMCKSRVSMTISEILDIFEQHLYKKWVILSQTEEEETSAKEYFNTVSGLPGVVGCVDNMYVQIKAPEKKIKDIYNNSQGLPSLNVMMICDHNMIIRHVDASQPGSYHDAYVWDQSTAENHFRTNCINGKADTWLVGDSAYNLLKYLMVPYRNPAKVHQKLFNEKLYKARRTIKRCFRMLRNRFSCLKTPKGMYYSPEKVTKAVISCCILHNICIAYKSNWAADTNSTEDNDSESDGTDESDISFDECAEARSLRDRLALPSTQSLEPQNLSGNNKDNHLHHYNMRDSTNVFNFSDDKFMRTFRVSKDIFSMLLEEITPKLKPTFRSTHTPASIKLAKFLAFLATGGPQACDHEYRSNISRSQASRIIGELLDIFEEHFYSKWIRLEQSQRDDCMAKESFYEVSGMPGVVGCVDNTHIQIKTPAKECKEFYCNRKGFCSLNVMMICDHNMLIKYVDADQPGSYHDAYVWDQSSANQYFKTNHSGQKTNTWLIGDAAYKLQPYFMVPYKNPSKDYEHKFNEKHLELRKIIRKCFAVVKNRFKCLNTATGLQYTPDKASKIIKTCCILHNICIHYKNYWLPCDDTEHPHNDYDNDNADDEENILEGANIRYANSIRNRIAKNLSC